MNKGRLYLKQVYPRRNLHEQREALLEASLSKKELHEQRKALLEASTFA
jgi:hypothetical protein